jgi:hypothetical protein
MFCIGIFLKMEDCVCLGWRWVFILYLGKYGIFPMIDSHRSMVRMLILVVESHRSMVHMLILGAIKVSI